MCWGIEELREVVQVNEEQRMIDCIQVWFQR
jgi:hypothetical protein